MWYLALFLYFSLSAMNIELLDKTVRVNDKTLQLLTTYSPVVHALRDNPSPTLSLRPLSSNEFALVKHYLNYLEKRETNDAKPHDKSALLQAVPDARAAAQLALAVDFLGVQRPPYEISDTIERYIKQTKKWRAWKQTKQLKLPHLLPASVTASLCEGLHRQLATMVSQDTAIKKYPITIPPPYNSCITGAYVSPLAKYYAMVHHDTVSVYHKSRAQLPKVHHFLGDVKKVTFLDDYTLAVGTTRGYVWVVDLGHNESCTSKPLYAHGNEILLLTRTPDNYILIGSQSCLSKVGKEGHTMWEHKTENRQETFAFTTVGFNTYQQVNTFITGEADGRALLWNGHNGLIMKELCTIPEPIVLVGFDEHSVPFVVGFRDNRLVCWNEKTKKVHSTISNQPHDNTQKATFSRGIIEQLWEHVSDKAQLALVNDSQEQQSAIILKPDKHQYCIMLKVPQGVYICDYAPKAGSFLATELHNDQETLQYIDVQHYAHEQSYLEVLSAAQLFFMYHVLSESAPLLINHPQIVDLFYSLPEYYQQQLQHLKKIAVPLSVRIQQKVPQSVKSLYAKIKALLYYYFGQRVTFRV